MPLKIVRQDITRMNVDAIVNSTNTRLIGLYATDGAIHRAAGKELDEACRKIGYCASGDAVITDGYNLPAKKVIHTVGPVWEGGIYGEKDTLRSCYRKSLELAVANKCSSIAFPVISSGSYGYPVADAMSVRSDTINEFLYEYEDDLDVFLVVYDKVSFTIGEALFDSIEQYIDDNYVSSRRHTGFAGGYHSQAKTDDDSEYFTKKRNKLKAEIVYDSFSAEEDYVFSEDNLLSAPETSLSPSEDAEKAVFSYAQLTPGVKKKPIKVTSEAPVKSIAPSKIPEKFVVDESFFEMVDRYIQKYEWKDSYFYKKANLTKSVFSKMKKPEYHPAKKTAVACALRLELPMDEFREMLAKAGYALSNSFLFDVIIKACIENNLYDITQINYILFDNDQELIGY